MYTGRLFHSYMLNDSICHFRGARSIMLLLFYFWWKILLANIVDPDDQGLQCLLTEFSIKNRIKPDQKPQRGV